MKKNINNNQTKYGASLIALAFSLSTANYTYALSCTTVPTCDELGYTRSVSECATTPLKCPFDQTKYHCLTADELAAITPYASNCAIGAILYSDKTCNANVVAGKTPIGIVFEPNRRLAIALSYAPKAWMNRPYEDVATLSNITSRSAATADWQGKSNTEKVWAFCNANGKTCPAFEYVNNYSTAGTDAGDWYLPAIGELHAIYVNVDILNTALSKIGGQSLQDATHWSSSEYNHDAAWYMGLYNNEAGSAHAYDKYDDKNWVRPVLAF